ncbi:hypothetical protein A6V36_33380 [Paraburkholderia ginsengiterrae]|uniref:Uncharacterized protein n=1 Tax=Paraburkholderia ginsengiterrae TaxID=1462993 RepID=A0A1A9N2N9_9BURK|nr:hypothetical protein A6V37_31670 [Paraburkholderia ginsengiterrae]OAJ56619.1 hypothetical protein A6V36_33380 [Paraburkholderia ginsengiterrae]
MHDPCAVSIFCAFNPPARADVLAVACDVQQCIAALDFFATVFIFCVASPDSDEGQMAYARDVG